MKIMKKIMILAVVAALLGISAPNTLAQVPGSSQPSSTQQDDDVNQESTTPSSPTTQPGTSGSQPGTSGSQSGTSGSAGTSGSSTSTMSEYNEEVKSADIPAAITRSLNEKYPGYKTEKAFRAKDGTYKVKVSKGDETQTLFFDERGESVKMHKK
jgi:hypothetical protein